MTVPDPIDAVCAYLKAQHAVATLLAEGPNGPLVFAPDLPQSQDKNMPQACVVARPAGGYTQYGEQTFAVADPRVDFICYGATQKQATLIARAVSLSMKQLIQPQVWENCWLFSAFISGGPIPLPDQQTLWPACWCSAVVMHGDYPAQ